MSGNDPRRWNNDYLVGQVEILTEKMAGRRDRHMLRELARRYREAMEKDRAQWESACKAFGLLPPIDRGTTTTPKDTTR